MSSVVQQAGAALIKGGLNAKAAAGVLGNAYGESGWNPAAMEPGTHNGGLWGFTSGSKSLDSLQAYAAKQGKPWTDPTTQANFVLTLLSPGDKQALNSQSTARSAASWFMNNWEMPYVPTEHEATRQDYAQKALGELSGMNLKGVPTPSVGGGKPGSTSITSKMTPGTVTDTQTGGGIDYKGALLSALLQSPKINVTTGAIPSGSSLLERALTNAQSGAFTTPTTSTITATKGSSDTVMKQVAGQKVQKMVNGKPVSGNANSITSLKGISTPKAAWNPSGKPVADWIVPILNAAYKAGVHFTLNSGYRSDAEQTAIYNSGVRPAAVPKSLGGSGSNHEGDVFPLGAVDIDGAQALSDWLLKSPYAKTLVYAGAKDPVHFSHPHDGGY